MDVYGHRGDRAHAAENTVAGVLRAFDAGAHGVELDVRRTVDDQLVLAHDPDVAGTTIARLAAAASGLDTVPDALDAARGRGRVVLEVKNLPTEADFDGSACRTADLLVALLAGRGDADDVVVSSFDWHSIERVRDAGYPTGFLLLPGVALAAGVTYAVDGRHREVHPHWTAVAGQPDAVAAAHDAGLRVVAWTVDDVDVARGLAAGGMDAVITDDPAALLAALS